MKLKYFVKSYHSGLPTELKDKLNGFATQVDGSTWEYEGTLDNFVAKWGNHVMIYPPDLIFVTQYNSFGAR